MAYDAARREVVLFGGGWSGRLNDTWTWNGAAWNQRNVPAPQPRTGHAMAYDAARGLVILFGGEGATGWLADTWVWNGASWGPLPTMTTPPPMTEHGLAYDASRQTMVLYGNKGSAVYETWELDAQDWHMRTPTVAPGRFTAMCTNPSTGRAFAQTSPGTSVLDWEFDGSVTPTTWRLLGSVSQKFLSLAPAPGGRLLGFTRQFFPFDSVFERAPSGGWTERITNIKPGIEAPVFDSGRGVIVAFNDQAETWEFDNEAWQAEVGVYGAGCGSPAFSLASLSGNRPIMGQVFSVDVTNVPAPSRAVMSIGSSMTQFGSFSLPLPLDFYGMTGCWLNQNQTFSGLPLMTSGQQGRFTVTIPLDRAFLAVGFYLQAFALAPGANPAGIVTSNGVKAVMGSY